MFLESGFYQSSSLTTCVLEVTTANMLKTSLVRILGHIRMYVHTNTEIRTLGLKVSLVRTLGLKASLVRTLGLKASLVRTLGLKASLVRTLGLKASLVRTLGLKASLVRTLGLKASDMSANNLHTYIHTYVCHTTH